MKNKSRSQVSESIKHTSEELPAELVELLEEDLQQVVGGLRITITPIRRPIGIGFPKLKQGWQK
jgi:hypothetical protein